MSNPLSTTTLSGTMTSVRPSPAIFAWTEDLRWSCPRLRLRLGDRGQRLDVLRVVFQDPLRRCKGVAEVAGLRLLLRDIREIHREINLRGSLCLRQRLENPLLASRTLPSSASLRAIWAISEAPSAPSRLSAADSPLARVLARPGVAGLHLRSRDVIEGPCLGVVVRFHPGCNRQCLGNSPLRLLHAPSLLLSLGDGEQRRTRFRSPFTRSAVAKAPRIFPAFACAFAIYTNASSLSRSTLIPSAVDSAARTLPAFACASAIATNAPSLSFPSLIPSAIDSAARTLPALARALTISANASSLRWSLNLSATAIDLENILSASRTSPASAWVPATTANAPALKWSCRILSAEAVAARTFPASTCALTMPLNAKPW